MKDGKKKSELDLESTFEKLQLKLNDIMGPLSRLASENQLISNWEAK